MRGQHEAHGSGARGEHLLPFRNLHMRRGAAHHRDDQRRARETGSFGFNVLGLGLRVFGAKRGDDGFARSQPRLPLENDEAPRHELAVVGHARGDREQRLDLGGRGGRAGEFDRLDGASRFEQVKSVGHRLGPQQGNATVSKDSRILRRHRSATAAPSIGRQR